MAECQLASLPIHMNESQLLLFLEKGFEKRQALSTTLLIYLVNRIKLEYINLQV